jgi:hypothetical protein
MLEDQTRSFELDQHADVAGTLVAVGSGWLRMIREQTIAAR